MKVLTPICKRRFTTDLADGVGVSSLWNLYQSVTDINAYKKLNYKESVAILVDAIVGE
jgi:hypothetical protein